MDSRTGSLPRGSKTIKIINSMFYIWHTLMIATFIGVAYWLGYTYGKRQIKIKKTVRKS